MKKYMFLQIGIMIIAGGLLVSCQKNCRPHQDRCGPNCQPAKAPQCQPCGPCKRY